MITEAKILTFMTTHTNRSSDLLAVLEVLSRLLDYVDRNTLKQITVGSNISLLFKRFEQHGKGVKDHQSLLTKIRTHIIDATDKIDDYECAIKSPKTIIFLDKLTQHHHCLINGSYQYVATPVIIIHYLIDMILSIWKQLDTDIEIPLRLPKLFYGLPFYLDELTKVESYFKCACQRGSSLLSDNPNKQQRHYLRWIADDQFDSLFALYITSFVSYAKTMNKYIDERQPALIHQLVVQLDELIRTSLSYRRTIYAKR